MTIFCLDKNNDYKESFGGMDIYKSCIDCECYLFELMCLEQKKDEDTEFNLYSRTLSYAQTCKQCACNSSQVEWTYHQQIVEDLP